MKKRICVILLIVSILALSACTVIYGGRPDDGFTEAATDGETETAVETETGETEPNETQIALETEPAETEATVETEPAETEVPTDPQETAGGNTEIPLEDLKQGDEVSVIGQKVNAGLVNGNTIWVQVQREDKSFVIFHCQLKEAYLSEAEMLKVLDVVKVRGYFLSLTDMEVENTPSVVTLYDCELISR